MPSHPPPPIPGGGDFSLFIAVIPEFEQATAISACRRKMERIADWMAMSGLKIKVGRTEICIFHRRNALMTDIIINGVTINTNNTMSVL